VRTSRNNEEQTERYSTLDLQRDPVDPTFSEGARRLVVQKQCPAAYVEATVSERITVKES
jgi:hypothetical protein